MMTQVFVHCREPFLFKGLEAALRHAGGFALVPCHGAPAALQQEIARVAPDVVLLELAPEITFAFLSELRRATPCKIVLWVNAISPELAVQAVTLGISAILRKSLPPKLQADCLRKVAADEVWFEQALDHGLPHARQTTLTPRENQILRLLSQGLKNREIASELAISESTVKVFLTKLFEKVGARDRFELALYALKNSISQPQPEAHDDDDAPQPTSGARPQPLYLS